MQNLHPRKFSIDRSDRERLAGHPGQVIWLTGLSGAGKSTIANALEVALYRHGSRTFVLDGDNIRQGLNKDLPFTDEGRIENIRRVAEVARLMMDAGIIVITAFISPFKRERELAKDLIGADRFCEVFVDTPLAICEARDPKGLYRKARGGLLQNMTGIDSAYERPQTPDVIVDGSTSSVQESVDAVCRLLRKVVHPVA
jgi:bifunctional enzyme CysN/CysC